MRKREIRISFPAISVKDNVWYGCDRIKKEEEKKAHRNFELGRDFFFFFSQNVVVGETKGRMRVVVVGPRYVEFKVCQEKMGKEIGKRRRGLETSKDTFSLSLSLSSLTFLPSFPPFLLASSHLFCVSRTFFLRRQSE